MSSKNLASCLGNLSFAAQNLGALGIFKEVHYKLDAPAQEKFTGPEGLEQALEIDVKLLERPRLWGQIGLQTDKNDVQGFFSGTFRNVFGGAEKLNFSFTQGLGLLSSNFGLGFSKPIGYRPDRIGSVNLNKLSTQYAAYVEDNTGLRLNYETMFAGMKIEFGYGAVWRVIRGFSADAAMSLRREGGHSTKSSVTGSAVLDRRDDPSCPRSGVALRLNGEIAGLGGDARFIKTSASMQTHYSLPLGLTASGHFNFGANLPLSSESIRLSDRFFQSQDSVRGFRQYGLGPRENGDALGANSYWTFSLGVSSPIPLVDSKFEKSVRLHGFVNGGAFSSLDLKKAFQSNRSGILSEFSPSVSSGVGLVFTLPVGRVELNYCIPTYTHRISDLSVKGFQVTFGTHL